MIPGPRRRTRPRCGRPSVRRWQDHESRSAAGERRTWPARQATTSQNTDARGWPPRSQTKSNTPFNIRQPRIKDTLVIDMIAPSIIGCTCHRASKTESRHQCGRARRPDQRPAWRDHSPTSSTRRCSSPATRSWAALLNLVCDVDVVDCGAWPGRYRRIRTRKSERPGRPSATSTASAAPERPLSSSRP